MSTSVWNVAMSWTTIVAPSLGIYLSFHSTGFLDWETRLWLLHWTGTPFHGNFVATANYRVPIAVWSGKAKHRTCEFCSIFYSLTARTFGPMTGILSYATMGYSCQWKSTMNTENNEVSTYLNDGFICIFLKVWGSKRKCNEYLAVSSVTRLMTKPTAYLRDAFITCLVHWWHLELARVNIVRAVRANFDFKSRHLRDVNARAGGACRATKINFVCTLNLRKHITTWG